MTIKAGCFFSHLLTIGRNENTPVEGVIEQLTERGLEVTDVDVETVRELGAEKINSIIKQGGISVSSAYYLIDFLHKEPKKLRRIYENIKADLAVCASIGSPFYMPVTCIAEEHESEADREECLKIITDYIGNLTEAAKEYGITVVLEDYSRLRTPLSKISDFQYIFSQVPDARFVLDTGNFWLAGVDVMEACQAFLDKTVHVHAKDLGKPIYGELDVSGRKADSIALGQGMIPMCEIFEVLQKNGYQDAAIIEPLSGRDMLPIMVNR